MSLRHARRAAAPPSAVRLLLARADRRHRRIADADGRDRAGRCIRLTNNPLDLGLVGLFQFMPAIGLVLVAGHIADRYDRRKIVRTCQFVAGLAGATLAVGTRRRLADRDALLTVVLVIGAARTFEADHVPTLLPAIVPLPLLARATAACVFGHPARRDRRPGARRPALCGQPGRWSMRYAARSTCRAGLLVSMIRIERVPRRRANRSA